MNSLPLPWLSWALASFIAALAGVGVAPSKDQLVRRATLVSAGFASFAITLSVSFFWRGAGSWLDPLVGPGGEAPLFELESLGAVLLPTTSLSVFALFLGAPARTWTKAVALSLLASLFGTWLLLLSANLGLLVVGWVLGMAPALFGSHPAHRPPSFVRRAHGASALLFAVAGGLIVSRSDGSSWSLHALALHPAGESRLAFGLLFVSALLRNAVFPFHSWAPLLAERTGLVRVAALLAPQAGAFLLLRVAAPLFPEHMAAAVPLVSRLAMVGSVYAALLGLAARDLRRALAWLFVSQSALVLVGLEAANVEGFAGAVFLWVGGSLSITGAALVMAGAEARVGLVDLRKYYGLLERAPVLGGLFLLFGMAVVGLPGTIGFVAEDLLVHGTLESFPTLGISIVLATAANGFLVLRAYFRVFGGVAPSSRQVPDVTRRERIAFLGLACLLLGLGLFPEALTRAQSPRGDPVATAPLVTRH